MDAYYVNRTGTELYVIISINATKLKQFSNFSWLKLPTFKY